MQNSGVAAKGLRPRANQICLLQNTELTMGVRSEVGVGLRPVEDFLEGTCFQEALPDPHVFENPEQVERVVFCTGKIFYDLMNYREEHAIYNTAIIRIEQLYPFHRQMVEAMIAPFTQVKNFVWCQEEPLNMGAWSYIWPRLDRTVHGKVRYAGRDAASSPAAGSKAMHYREQKELLAHAFTV